MVRLARFVVALPGKTVEVAGILKEAAAVIKSVSGVEVMIFNSLGAKVGEFASVTNYDNLADFEEKGAKILGNAEYQAVVKKLDGMLVPGASFDHLLRQI